MDVISSELTSKGYNLIEPIGKGGSATCYIVQSIKYNKKFVCKLIKQNGKIQNSYVAEIKALLELDHPNIVLIFDHFDITEYHCIILEYCTGGCLDEYVDNEVILDQQKLYFYVGQLISAIQYLHQEQNIAHHDIKPANLLIDKNGRLNLADFGIAKKYETDQLSTSYRGTLIFSPPEIILKNPYDPFKADIYSLGMTIYCLATGMLPFYETDIERLKRNIVANNLFYPESLSKEILSLIRKCISYSPNERPTINRVLTMWKDIFKYETSRVYDRLPSLDLYRHQIKVAKENQKNGMRKYVSLKKHYGSIGLSMSRPNIPMLRRIPA